MPSLGREPKLSGLERELLLSVARVLGPDVDRVEPDVQATEVRVRDLVLEFDGVGKGKGTPAEVRHALLSLIRRGLLDFGFRGDAHPELRDPEASVWLRLAGLVRARRFDARVGRTPGKRFTLRIRKGRSGEFDARFDTGNKDRDRDLNKRGAVLAALYGLVVLEAHVERVKTRELLDVAELLGVHGVRARSGRTDGERVGVSDEALTEALGLLRSILPGLMPDKDRADRRLSCWHLAEGWPSILVEGPKDRIGSWPELVYRLRSVVRMARQAREKAEEERAKKERSDKERASATQG